MAADVDIIVTGSDSTEVRMIAEAKLSLADLNAAERELKETMLRMSAPVGLLVTPEKMRVYVDRYISQTPESVDRVGEFDVSKFLAFRPRSSSADETREFENRVQHWLEDLPSKAAQIARNGDIFWTVVKSYIVPAIESGKIRAAAPRYAH
jgi:hypothetical protein